MLETLDRVLALQAKRVPDAPAVCLADVRLTFQQLDARVDAIAECLRDVGVGPESIVAVCLPRSNDLVATFLAVLRARGAYLPLDPNYPQERLRFMLEDSRAPVLVLEASASVPAWAQGAGILRLPPQDATARAIPAPLEVDRAAELAYLIYTSGSTGRPKGVLIEHRGVVNMAVAMARAADLSAGARMLQFSSPSFDAFVAEVSMSLTAGATLVIAPPDRLAGVELMSLMRGERIACALLPPSILATLAQDEDLPDLRSLIVGGEACPAPLARRWGRGRRLVNAYGPTEITVCATLEVSAEIGERLSIGRAFEGVELHLLDEQMHSVRAGETGEIHIGGIGLARGYLRREELTAERFIANPFAAGDPQARLYRTGDLARRLPDGRIDYVGRVDHQVKIRGLRIELGEIETVLAHHPAVRECVVVDREDPQGQKRLFAYLVTHKAAPVPTVAELHAHLKQALPEYMLPASFTVLPRMPLTPNGKIDRAALPRPTGQRPDTGVPFVLPGTPTETLLHDQWARLLSVDHIGIHDDFFMAGGDSLLAVQAVTRALRAMNIDRDHHMECLHGFLEAPTISAFASLLDRPGELKSSREKVLDFEAEARLDPALDFRQAPRARREPPAILLTGVTGFLGAFLLVKLIERTGAAIHCLVRARDEAQARLRIQKNLQRYGIWHPELESRIVPVAGDLAQPRFGLSEHAFAQLASTVESIYHSGAEVNFLYPYSALRAANVGGTHEVIRLATQGNMTPVHFVSTFAVLASHGLRDEARVSEDSPLVDPHRLFMGYIESKWVAEHMLWEARERGLPVSVYRPTHITGTVREGAWKLDQFLCSLIQSFTDVGSAPAIPFNLDFVPVDYVADAIVSIGHAGDSPHWVFNVGSPGFKLLPAMIDRMRRAGYPVGLEPYDAWLSRVLGHATAHPDRPIANFMSLLQQQWSERKLHLLEIYAGGVYPQLDCSHTTEALRGSGVACPPTDSQLIDRYIDQFAEQGLIPPASRASNCPEL